ncbi:hypothetical protein DRO66_06370, partial [Candidatus Bathyarchaeota archaeon]
ITHNVAGKSVTGDKLKKEIDETVAEVKALEDEVSLRQGASGLAELIRTVSIAATRDIAESRQNTLESHLGVGRGAILFEDFFNANIGNEVIKLRDVRTKEMAAKWADVELFGGDPDNWYHRAFNMIDEFVAILTPMKRALRVDVTEGLLSGAPSFETKTRFINNLRSAEEGSNEEGQLVKLFSTVMPNGRRTSEDTDAKDLFRMFDWAMDESTRQKYAEERAKKKGDA